MQCVALIQNILSVFLQISEVRNMYLTVWCSRFLQGMGESVRHCLLKFALSFLVVAESDVISAILELKGETHNDTLMHDCIHVHKALVNG